MYPIATKYSGKQTVEINSQRQIRLCVTYELKKQTKSTSTVYKLCNQTVSSTVGLLPGLKTAKLM